MPIIIIYRSEMSETKKSCLDIIDINCAIMCLENLIGEIKTKLLTMANSCKGSIGNFNFLCYIILTIFDF